MNVWEEIKSKIDIVDVISEYIPILPAGTNYRALSPFKKEKTPSLMISQQKQIWHDFSTGRGGDIFGFVMQIENITRAEALQKLAAKAGITLKNYSQTEEGQPLSVEEKNIHQAGSNTLEWARELYHSLLLKILQDRTSPITQYCISRRLTPKLIKDFQIGYAPKNNFLVYFLHKKNQNTHLFEQTQLLIERKGQLKDKFVDRLMIPIRNLEGKTVGFTARVLPYDTSERPKYLNSAQSEWFDKSNLWFGLHLARKTILLEKKALVVEGNMDVIAAFGAGFEYAVASQGTSFTSQQLNLLKRFTTTVLLAFDNDEAGIQAGYKFFMEATKIGIRVNQVVIPQEYKDLDEYLAKNSGSTSLENEYYIERWIKLNTPRLTSTNTLIQKQTIEECCKLLTVVDDITLEQYVAKLYAITGISIKTLQRLVAQINAAHKQYSNPIKQEDQISLVPNSNPLKENLTIAFQKLVIATTNNPSYYTWIETLYPLLIKLGVVEEPTFPDYLSIRKPELQLIQEEEQKTIAIPPLIKNIEQSLDSSLPAFLEDEELLQCYYTFKKIIQIQP